MNRPDSRLQGQTILVLEDNLSIQAALAEALTMENYCVLKASNGKPIYNSRSSCARCTASDLL